MAELIELVWEDGQEVDPSTGDFSGPRKYRAIYNTVEEALIQAGHNELMASGRVQHIEIDGKKQDLDIKLAAKRIDEARKDHQKLLESGPDLLKAVRG